MTVPTIAELSGNTVLELFKNGYEALKENKQEKLVAGDNISIDGNTISATVNLSNYYTKPEINSQLNLKANKTEVYEKDDVYNKEEVDDAIIAVASEIPDMKYYYTKTEVDELIEGIGGGGGYRPTNSVTYEIKTDATTGEKYIEFDGILNGDIVYMNLDYTMAIEGSAASSGVSSGINFFMNSGMACNVGSDTGITDAGNTFYMAFTNYYVTDGSYGTTHKATMNITGKIGNHLNGFTCQDAICGAITINNFKVLRVVSE